MSGSAGFLVGSGEPRICSDQWLHDCEAFFTRDHVEVGASWRCFLSVLARGVLQMAHTVFHSGVTMSGRAHVALRRREPKLRSDRGLQDIEQLSFDVRAGALHSCSPKLASQFTPEGSFTFHACTGAHSRASIFMLHNVGNFCVTASPVSAE